MVFVLFVLTVILFSVTWFQMKYGRKRTLGNRFPGPKNVPFLGNAHSFINVPVENNMKILYDWYLEFGDTYRVWIGNELNVFFINRKDLEVIMSGMAFVDKASEYDFMHPWLNEGLLVSKGKKWHTRRKIITPAFHFKILEEYLHVFEKQGRIFCKILESQVGVEECNLHEFISRYTLDVISVVLSSKENEKRAKIRRPFMEPSFGSRRGVSKISENILQTLITKHKVRKPVHIEAACSRIIRFSQNNMYTSM